MKLSRSLVVALGLGALAVAAQAQYTGLYTFNGNYDGDTPYYADYLAQGPDGNLHGSMPTGAWAAPSGSTFDYTIGGSVKINELNSASQAQNPYAGLTLGIDGNLYGASVHGAVDNMTGKPLPYGTLFRIANGVMTRVFSFQGGTNGSYPYAPPIQAPDGNLYGVTYDGAGTGYVYQVLMSNGTGSAGWCHPLPAGARASLIMASDGNLYGTIPGSSFVIVGQSSGSSGAIFQVTLAGVITGIHNFNPSSAINNGAGDGSNPWGAVMQAADGYLYGMTSMGGAYGGGTLYRMALNGTNFSVIHNFQYNDGTAPSGGLVQGSDGYIYGLTTAGGYIRQIWLIGGGPLFTVGGTIFKTDTTGANFTRMYTFYGSNQNGLQGSGLYGFATPTLHTSGVLYGLTEKGGSGATNINSFGTYDNGGEMFSYGTGMAPFVNVVVQRKAKVGDWISLIGQGFLGTQGVTFGGTPAVLKGGVQVISDTFMRVAVPTGAVTGPVVVQELNGNVSTPYNLTIQCTLLRCP